MNALTDLPATRPAAQPVPTSRPEPAPPVAEVISDVHLAVQLSAPGARATGPAAEELRARLRSYIRALIGSAETYAIALTDLRQRETITDRINFAQCLAGKPHADPRHDLRLLAKSTDQLLHYASRVGAQAPVDFRLPPCELARHPSGVYDVDVTHGLCPGTAPPASGGLQRECECPCHIGPAA
jgi:hypothetical protein